MHRRQQSGLVSKRRTVIYPLGGRRAVTASEEYRNRRYSPMRRPVFRSPSPSSRPDDDRHDVRQS